MFLKPAQGRQVEIEKAGPKVRAVCAGVGAGGLCRMVGTCECFVGVSMNMKHENIHENRSDGSIVIVKLL